MAEYFHFVSDSQANANHLSQMKSLPELGRHPALGRLYRASAVPFLPIQGALNRPALKCKIFSSHGTHSPIELCRRLSLLCFKTAFT